jgi:type IV secretory pathway VirD2 relaxase
LLLFAILFRERAAPVELMDEVKADAPPVDVSDEVKARANELKDTGNKQLAGKSCLSSAALVLHTLFEPH